MAFYTPIIGGGGGGDLTNDEIIFVQGLEQLTYDENDFLVSISGSLSDRTPTQVRAILGLATTDNPQFVGINVGHATDTTITRVSAGVIAVEGTNVQLQLSEGGFVDGDKTKLSGIESGADVTDENNVKSALNGATLTDVGTPASGDRILLQDASDSNNLKMALFSEFGGASGTQSINSETAGSATLVVGELSTGAGSILNIVTSNAASQTITLPGALVGDVGKWFKIYNAGTNKMTISSASSLAGDTTLAVEAGCVAYITSTGNYALIGTGNPTFEIQMAVTEWGTALTTGDGKYYFRVPAKFNGYEITAVHAEVITAGTTGTTDVQIHNVTDAVDILSTKLTIDSGETGSDTAATAAVINTGNNTLATEDRLRVDIDAVSTTAPEGLIVTLTVQPK